MDNMRISRAVFVSKKKFNHGKMLWLAVEMLVQQSLSRYPKQKQA